MTTSVSDALVERLGEALFVLSDRLRASGIISASDAVHDAYEAVVAAFQALSAIPPEGRELDARLDRAAAEGGLTALRKVQDFVNDEPARDAIEAERKRLIAMRDEARTALQGDTPQGGGT